MKPKPPNYFSPISAAILASLIALNIAGMIWGQFGESWADVLSFVAICACFQLLHAEDRKTRRPSTTSPVFNFIVSGQTPEVDLQRIQQLIAEASKWRR